MPKLLLLGASGFLGQHLTRYLRTNTDWEVSFGSKDLGQPLPNLGGFEYIVNLASRSGVEASIKDPVGTISNNVNLMLNALEYARKHPPKVFLHMSTVEVYNVTNAYGASKAAQEDIANAYYKTYSIPVVIVRSSNIIGSGQGADKFVPKIINQIKNGETVSIYTSEGRQGSRLYIPVTNVVDAILFLLKNYPYNDDNHKDFPIHFDITGGQKLTNLHMAEKIAQLLDKPLHYELIEPKEVRPLYARSLVTHGTKLNKIGWSAPVKTLEDMLSWVQ